ncbi:MAG TPA: carbohydrate ABC transporter permease [Clostridiaceae bacterium]
MKKFKKEIFFDVFNHIFLIAIALACVLPFVHVAAISFSSSAAATSGAVKLWPVDFNLDSYIYAFGKSEFLNAFKNSIFRVLLGVSLDMILVILTAYPLSKNSKEFPGRTYLVWFFVITMFVSGGLIPSYLIVTATGLRNTIWALVIPGTVNAFNITVLLNFFRQLPKEFDEAALLDGANQWQVLFYIYIPLSVPCLVTLVIFVTVGHWNEWFSALIYMDSPAKYPLQTYLQTLVITPNFDSANPDQIKELANISSRTYNAAQIMIATLPILCIYPSLQKYFVKGLTLGGLKG